ncbi:MAG: class I SAM-dependent DNA methyltransferase [Deltaproteobacteria bacterium]|nr:class I SAM-dependent DNA methyltransferase [Deltaproteobacteria bacterium]
MPRDAATPVPDWEQNLYDRLQIFVNCWRSFEGTERAGAQEFLHRLVEIYEVSYKPGTIFEQHPIRLPARGMGIRAAQGSLFAGEQAPGFTTERMDMYLPKVCVWEMKAPAEKDLQKHHEQLLGYWARVRTRYMVLCNFHEFWIYDTNEENGQLVPKLCFPLAELPARGDALLFLRGEEAELAGRSERVTAEVARMLGRIVRELIETSADPAGDRERVTKLILQCMFAMFAEDTDLIPPGMFTRVVQEADKDGRLVPVFSLFDDFARQDGGKSHPLAPFVDGSLFDRSQPRVPLSPEQIHDIHCAARNFDWRDVRPEIFGSIFEQALDPSERHELGAHFTREADIARVVLPSVVAPWRQRIAELRTPKETERAIEQMRAFHVLDPACGCGNFLYVVYREMKRLESALARKWTEIYRHKVAKRKSDIPPPPPRPYFSIHQLHGIELSSFAAFLARVVLWIGEHLAKQELGLDEETLPLKSLEQNIRHADALLVDWPRPEGELAIVSNPPYLGVRKLRRELGDDYVDGMFARYPVNRAADYVTYWFTRALEVLQPGERAGYVCTNSIAQNESREASIDRLLARGATITDAWKSYPWPGEAAVHIGIVNWVMAKYEGVLVLDGKEVASISPGLTAGADVTAARHLAANEGLCFMGVTPGNSGFVLTDEQRSEILASDPGSSEVIRPFLIGRDVNREPAQQPTRWIIDFGMMAKEQARTFGGAFRYVQRHVYGAKQAETARKTEGEKDRWWQFVRPRPDLREALVGVKRVLVFTRVSPHLILSRQSSSICFDAQLQVVALGDYYHFGVLQSRIHGAWAWARGSTLKGDLRYTNTTIFETFPFPPLADAKYDPRARPRTAEAGRLAAAAEAFDHLRSATCRERGLGLTKIHNELEAGTLPELRAAFDELNDAVCACYGFPAGTWRDEREILRRLLERGSEVADG